MLPSIPPINLPSILKLNIALYNNLTISPPPKGSLATVNIPKIQPSPYKPPRKRIPKVLLHIAKSFNPAEAFLKLANFYSFR
jgi:hypothetical protein